MRRILLLFAVMMMVPAAALAEGLSFTVLPEEIHPGKVERISFTVPENGTGRLGLSAENGGEEIVIRNDFSVSAGENHLTWDGMDENGQPVAPGNYEILLTAGQNAVSAPLSIGVASPQITSLSTYSVLVVQQDWQFTVQVNEAGTLEARIRPKTGDAAWKTIFSQAVDAGETVCRWNGEAEGEAVGPGEYSVQLTLTNPQGMTGTARQVSLTIIETTTSEPTLAPTPAPTPRVLIPSAASAPDADAADYWTLPIGVMDEAAIWNVMTQPMTVIDGNEKEVYRLRKTPDNSTKRDNVVGEITYASQGVHILETRDDGWTLVEAYNSSYGPNCTSRPGYGVTDDFIQGYVKTSLLKTITPNTEYGLLVDKLEQKMYIFSEGKCIGSLLVSTGLNNAKQSWNETPSGEFVMISRMGGFPAGNLWCAYGMRINGGCAIHEVPYIGNADTPAERRDYSSTVRMLGQKASHGCIRVQKAANEQGQNIKWLWDNIKKNTKVLIWDDTGRMRPYPAADDYELYYNPDGGKYYHENQYCPSVKSRFLPLTAFTYGELDEGDFAKLKPCAKCASILRKSEIDAMNAEIAGN